MPQTRAILRSGVVSEHYTKIIALLPIALFIACMFLPDRLQYGFSKTSPWWTHLSYMLVHVTVWHLLLNCFSWVMIVRLLQPLTNLVTAITTAIVSAFLASWTSSAALPTLGCSGIIYAAVGIFISLPLFSPTVKLRSPLKFFIFIVAISAVLLAGYFRGDSNTALHVVSLLLGSSFYTLLLIFVNHSNAR